MDELRVSKNIFLLNFFLLPNQKNIFSFWTLNNNYNFLLLLSTVSFFFKPFFNADVLKILTFKVKKNNLYSEYLLKKNNFFFYKKKYLFAKNYKFNKFFLFSNTTFILNNSTRRSIAPLLFKAQSHFFFNVLISKFLNKRSFKISGNLLSPFSWNLQNFKIKNSNSIFFTKKNRIKKPAPLLSNNPLTALSFYYKKILLNNFFYFNRFVLSYKILSNLKNLYFIKSKLKKKSNKLFYKPYSFLNNTSFFKNQRSITKTLYTNFKKLSKVFNLFKKINFKNKNKNRLKASHFFFKKSTRTYLTDKVNTYFLSTSMFPFFLNNCTKNSLNNPVFQTKRGFFHTKYSSRVRSNFFFKHVFSNQKFFTIPFLKKYKISSRKIFKIKKCVIILHQLGSAFTGYKYMYALDYNKTISTRSYNLLNFPPFGYNYRSTNNSLNLFFTNNKPFLNLFCHSGRYSNHPTTGCILSSSFQILANTRTRYRLVFGLSGFLFVTNFSYFNQMKKDLLFLMKKNYYSFSQKNDMQRFILKRYLKNKFITTPDKTNFIKNSNFQNTSNLQYSSYNFFSSTPRSPQFSLLTSHLGNRKWIATGINELYSDTLFGIDYTFSIKRIKFKPGYMTMWRSARETLKTLMGLKFKYQNKLTKYLTKFNKSTKIKTFLILEFQLINIILKSKLLPDKNFIELFLNNNLIFINGKVCNNPFFSLFVGDFIQLVVHNKYYILYRWMSHWNIQKKIRLKLKSKKKLNNQTFGDDKQHSNTFPKWILKNKDIINDCARYLEVDYFTLSIFFIYEPFTWSDLNPYNLTNIKFGIINLYNWKYIT